MASPSSETNAREPVSRKPFTESTVGVAGELRRELLDALAPGGALDVHVLDEDDYVRRPVARVLEALGGDHRLGLGIVGAVGVEAVGHGAAERAGDHEEDDGADRDEAAALLDEVGESVEHQAAFLAGSRSAMARSHQETHHSCISMP